VRIIFYILSRISTKVAFSVVVGTIVLTTRVHLTVGLGFPLPLQYIFTFCPFSASSLASLLAWMEGGAENTIFMFGYKSETICWLGAELLCTYEVWLVE
jgi:hypothetical protein